MAPLGAPKLSSHDVAGFEATLGARSVHTRRAYVHDVTEFATWCERGGCAEAVVARSDDDAVGVRHATGDTTATPPRGRLGA